MFNTCEVRKTFGLFYVAKKYFVLLSYIRKQLCRPHLNPSVHARTFAPDYPDE